MRQSGAWIASLALLALASGQTALAAPCKTVGSKDAKELTLDLHDPDTQHGLEHSLMFGLGPSTFPVANLRTLKNPCSRGQIVVGEETLEIWGENTDSPVRWAQSALPNSPLIFLSRAPRPQSALKHADSGPVVNPDVRYAEDEAMYVVAITGNAGDRLVTHFLDKLPDDKKLRSIIADIVSNKVSVIVALKPGQVFEPHKPAPN